MTQSPLPSSDERANELEGYLTDMAINYANGHPTDFAECARKVADHFVDANKMVPAAPAVGAPVSSIEETCAVLKRHLIEPDERTDCTIVYRVTFDQLRNLYDSGKTFAHSPAASLREQEGTQDGWVQCPECLAGVPLKDTQPVANLLDRASITTILQWRVDAARYREVLRTGIPYSKDFNLTDEQIAASVDERIARRLERGSAEKDKP
jgi:hypothetical protein